MDKSCKLIISNKYCNIPMKNILLLFILIPELLYIPLPIE